MGNLIVEAKAIPPPAGRTIILKSLGALKDVALVLRKPILKFEEGGETSYWIADNGFLYCCFEEGGK